MAASPAGDSCEAGAVRQPGGATVRGPGDPESGSEPPFEREPGGRSHEPPHPDGRSTPPKYLIPDFPSPIFGKTPLRKILKTEYPKNPGFAIRAWSFEADQFALTA